MPPPPSKNIYGFDPRSVPGCQLWFDAADASSIQYGVNATGASVIATGGTVNDISVGGNSYRTHTFTTTGDSTFTLTTGSATVNYLVVAGGGGGGVGRGGGGGGGGVLTGTTVLTAGSYTITVGAAGANAYNDLQGGDGGTSSISSLVVATGGGGGGGWQTNAGRNGGSGGGASAGSTAAAGTGVSGQGYAGSVRYSVDVGGGGGGAGGAAYGSTGGIGIASSIRGTIGYYGGGGGAGADGAGIPGVAYGGIADTSNGKYGGGNGANTPNTHHNYQDAVPNTGGGGGGQEGYGGNSGYGGSGIVVISYSIPIITATGGTTTDTVVGGILYRNHVFTSSGTFALTTSSATVQAVIVGGGGGGGGSNDGGGGGAGGVANITTTLSSGNYSIVVGLGGQGLAYNTYNVDGNDGQNSSAFNYIGYGGGGGSGSTGGSRPGHSGGCGGGGSFSVTSSVGGSPTQVGGYAGGNGQYPNAAGGGGGGMGGSPPYTNSNIGYAYGGPGKIYTIGGVSYLLAAGGAAGVDSGSTQPLGGSGIGGNGGWRQSAGTYAPTAGAANTGSGGGGLTDAISGGSGYYGGGGSGVVIISYAIGSLATGSTVSVWQDKSGNGYDLTSVGTNPPTYSADAFNGYPCLVFTNGQYQDMATAVVNMTTFIPPSAGYSYFAVFNQTGGTCSGLWFQQTGVASGARGCEANGSNIQYDVNGTAYIVGPQNANLMLSVVCTTGNQSSTADNGSIYYNGTSVQSAKTFGTATFNYTDKVVLFAKDSNHNYRAYGYAAEFLQFNRALTTLEQQQIEGYLAWKWGLGAAGSTQILTYTGFDQSYVVPVGCSNVTVYMWGGGGGSSAQYVGVGRGGSGAYITGTLPVTPGETLNIIVAGGGGASSSPSLGGYGGGGYGNYGANTYSGGPTTNGGNGTGGGGRSAIQRGGTDIVTVGGGGGAGYSQGGAAAWTGTATMGEINGGGGGTPTSGGAAGSSGNPTSFGVPTAGTHFQGGNGNNYGGGGGGGWYGGGGGNTAGGAGGDGGGGSSYTANLVNASGINGAGGDPGGTSNAYYMGRVAVGGNCYATQSGGNGLVVIVAGNVPLPSTHLFYPLQPFVRQFNPIDIDGCVLWLDGADGSSMSFSSGNNISQWFDKSGNGNSTTTTTGTSTWTASAINGLNAVQFNSASWFLGPSVNNGAVLTVFVVGTMTGQNSGTGARTDVVRMVSLATPSIHDYNSSLTTGAFWRYDSTSSIMSYRSPNYLSTGYVGYSTPFLACTLYDGTNNTMYVNGVAGSSVATSGNFGYTTYGIGCDPALDNTPWNGFVGEVIIYNAALTTIQRQQVEGYLAKKWNIEIGITNPKTIPSCVLWVDGSDITNSGSSVANGTTITNWIDKTGLNSVTSAGSAATKSALGVVFGGSSYFTIAGSAVGSIANIPFVIFIVETYAGGSGYMFGDDTVTGTDASLHIGYRSSTDMGFCFYSDDLEDTVISGTGTTRVWAFYLPTSSNRVTRRNGAIDVTHWNYNRLTALVTPVIGRVFGGNYYTGTIGEIIVYNTDIGLTRIQEIESYLLKKWQVTGTSVYNHPYVALPPSSIVPFIPTNIATCALWLDGADPLATGKAPPDSTSLTTWFDKSGNGVKGDVNGTVTYQVPFINGLGSVKFPGSGYIQNSTFSLTLATKTFFMVCSSYGAVANANPAGFMSFGNSAYVYDSHSGTAYQGPESAFGNQFGFLQSYGNGGYYTSYGSPFGETPLAIYGDTQNGTAAVVYVNGSVLATNTLSYTPLNSTGFRMGRRSDALGQYLYGNICEVIVYNSVLTSSQRWQVEGYLAKKWGLSKSLQSTHAYTNFEPSIPAPVPVDPLSPLYAFTTFTFTNCDQTGPTGPTISQCTSAYSAYSWTANTAFFNMTTTGYQLWTVPDTAPYLVVAAGAATSSITSNAGYGVIIQTTLNLTKGQVVQILVGQKAPGSTTSTGGGGGTFIASGSTPSTGGCLVAAGGGGGHCGPYGADGGTAQNGTINTSGNNSSDGMGTGGTNGGGGTGANSGFGGGGGGFSGNGTAAYYAAGFSYQGYGTSFTNGGIGGNTAQYAFGGFGGGAGTHGNTGGGGGGGGYSGGGGSGQNSSTATGGGGGSFSIGTLTYVGLNSGMGYVTITKKSFGPPESVTLSSIDNFRKNAVVSWPAVYQAASYTVKIYQNASNSTTGGTLLGTATTANTTYTFTGLTIASYAAYYANFLLTTFYANTGSIPNASGPTDAGGNGAGWGSIIQSAQALDPIYFGNNLGVYIAGQGNYSALTTGYVYSASVGTIQFQGITDDGLIVNFNGSNVIYQYQQQGSTTYYSGSLTLPAGYTPIRITWYDTGGGGDYRIYFSINGGAYTNSGTGVFYNQVPAGLGYAYATVFATNSTPTDSAATTSTTLPILSILPSVPTNATNLAGQTVVTTWTFADHAYVTNYTVSLYTNTTSSTSGATLVTTITTANLTCTFSGLSLVAGIYLFTTIYATGSASTTSTIYSIITLVQSSLYSFTTITFTPCGYTGQTGPPISACTSSYSASNSWVTNTSFFNMTTTGYQRWTVPASQNYIFQCAGAGGGVASSGGGTPGGTGIIQNVSIALTQGDIITILVGQAGTNTMLSPGGGGGTFVYNTTTSTLLIASGGGGGGAYSGGNDAGVNATLSTSGNTGKVGISGVIGNGGTGGNGGGAGNYSYYQPGNGGGGGGFSGNGGVNPYSGAGGPTTAYSYLNGGGGGGQGGSSTYAGPGGFGGGGGGEWYYWTGSGGGGGYSGGGGGVYYGNGGGGGSYCINTISSSGTNSSGSQGYVTVST